MSECRDFAIARRPQHPTNETRLRNRFSECPRPLVVDHQRNNYEIANIASRTTIEDITNYLSQELGASTTYRQVWERANVEFNQIPNDQTNNFYHAILAYTFEDEDPRLQIYEEFNKACREMKNMSDWTKFPYKSLYCLLAQAATRVESTPRVTDIRAIYRGTHQECCLRVNSEYCFQQFTSFSVMKSVSEEFAEGPNGILFVIEPPFRPNTMLGIQNYSYYEGEGEVLIMPWSQFIVKSITKQPKYTEIILQSVPNSSHGHKRDEL